MAWYQKICNQCDAEVRVPRNGPVDFVDGVTLTYLELQPEFVMQHQQEPSWPTACCEVTAITSVKSAEGKNLSVVNVRYLINFNVILSACFFGQTFFVARGSAMVSSFSFRICS
jgi:hypothetical protein